MLGQTLTTELPRGAGSRAAAQVHEAVRRDILSADARRLEETLSRDLIKPLVDLNAGPQRRYPRLQLALPDTQDTKLFADMVAELTDRGLRVGQKTILDRLGLPEAAEGEAVLSPGAGGFERLSIFIRITGKRGSLLKINQMKHFTLSRRLDD